MIAMFEVVLPFEFTVPEKETFNVLEYQLKEYKIRVMPPMKTNVATRGDVVEQVLLNGKKAFIANGLRIIFDKKKFQRKLNSECDPPLDFIGFILNMFLNNVRFVTRNDKARAIDLEKTSWVLKYLNDDGSELRKNKNFIKTRGSQTFKFEWAAMNSEIWKNIFSLPLNYTPPQWEMMLIDASAALPEVGQAIVLASTSLEVFIAYILNEMSKISGMPEHLWRWIHDREKFSKNPLLVEQYSTLLNVVAGFSLKEDKFLWKAFNLIRGARNKFVHEGVAKIKEKEVTETQAREFVQKTREIIDFIKGKLPNDLRWPAFNYNINIEFTFPKANKYMVNKLK